MMLAAAAAVICDRSLDAWITDVEDSDSSTAESSFGRSDFSTCIQCKGVNRNALYPYCEKCFQVHIDGFDVAMDLQSYLIHIVFVLNCLEGFLAGPSGYLIDLDLSVSVWTPLVKWD